MIRFIHTADIHFGMENYGRIDPETGIHSRLLDFYKAFNLCIDTAIEEKVDFFLFCGDAYKTPHPTQTQQKLLLQCFLRLYKANIPIIAITGNHDHPLSFGRVHALDILDEIPLDGFHVIAKPQTIQLITKNGPINIVGIPWPTRNTITIADRNLSTTATELTRHISKSVCIIIRKLAADLDPTIPAVLAGHLTVANGIFSGSEKRAVYGTDPIFLPSELAIAPFDYVALGHLHRYQDLNPHGYPAVVYSGSIERIDFGEHKEDKGFCIVSIECKGATTHTFVMLPVRPFIQIHVTLIIGQSFTQQIINAIAQREISDAIVKIIYHVPDTDTKEIIDLKAVQNACRSAWAISSITPVRNVTTRERRLTNDIQPNADPAELIGSYCLTKPELKNKYEKLVSLTRQLLATSEEQDKEEQIQF